jgi:Alpha amylase, catalytic domain
MTGCESDELRVMSAPDGSHFLDATRDRQYVTPVQHPLLYEINTRCWLWDLSKTHGHKVTLSNVPAQEFARWQGLGFTHVWLMGVWTTGPKSRAPALAEPGLRRAYDAALPGWREQDVAGSPYAIADYRVPRALGGEAGLTKFRRTLHAHGLKLVLDFVPNHLGLDHRWLSERPDLFMQNPVEVPGTFAQETATGIRWLAHGKDPYFPPWTDTAQLDYRRFGTRAAMKELLLSVAARCDGVRCDMAMLLLNDVFKRTWANFPYEAEMPESEFWTDAISAVKHDHPKFLFLAEVYWDLEAEMQKLGFDYTYDKRLYDELFWHNAAGAQRWLLDAPREFIAASAHFLENHDEPRIASQLSPAEHRAAALVTLGLPGMRLLHEGQLTGARVKIPVQLVRRPEEAPDLEIKKTYEQMLGALMCTDVGQGQFQVLSPRAAWPGNPTSKDFVIVQWQVQPPEFNVVVVNLAAHPSQCYAPLTVPKLSDYNWSMRDLLGQERHERFGADLMQHGLYLDLPAHSAQLFHFEPTR